MKDFIVDGLVVNLRVSHGVRTFPAKVDLHCLCKFKLCEVSQKVCAIPRVFVLSSQLFILPFTAAAEARGNCSLLMRPFLFLLVGADPYVC